MSSLVINDPRNGELIEYKSGNITKKKKEKKRKGATYSTNRFKAMTACHAINEKYGSV